LGREAWVGYGGHHRGKRANEMAAQNRMDEYYTREAEDKVALVRKLELDFLPILPHGKVSTGPKMLAENVWRYGDPKGEDWSIWKYQPESDMYSEIDSAMVHLGLLGFERMVERMEASTPSVEGLDFAQVEWIRQEIGKDVFLVGNVDVYFGMHMAAASVLFEAVALRPDLMDRYLDCQMAFALLFVEAQSRHGIDAVLGGEDWAGKNGPLISPKHFRRFILPRMRTLVKKCHELGLFFIEQELLVESGIDAYHAIEPAAGMDIGYLKQRYGSHLTLMGNVDCGRLLGEGTSEEVTAQTRRVIQAAAPGGGFVLTSSNSIHRGVKVENYLTMLETARKYGVYPIQGN
jgi:uroporphyrinogen decarboxylase